MRSRGIVPLALVLGLTAAGCSNGNGLTGNIGDLVDEVTGLIPDTKKPLPGERKAVFPEGVPGVAQGVPPELMKGNQPAPEAVAEPAPAEQPATPAAKPEKQAKPKANASAPQSISPGDGPDHAKAAASEKPKPKKKVAAKPAPQQAQAQPQPPQKQTNQAAWPGVSPAQSGTAAWPAPQSQPTAWPSPAPQPQPTTAWPDPRQPQQQAQ
jgi:hypothetical protein